MSDIWTEKYRPERLEDVVNQKHVVDRLKAWVKEGSIPHMLFAGRAGVGKTTVALCLAKELYGENWKSNFQETNASDQRGIDVVRGRIKEFAKIMPMGADFKIVFLDESDALTPEAQQALRRTMEKFSNVCRFILSCNYSSRVIEPIQSRTAVFRFKNIGEEYVIEYLNRIVSGEKLKADKEALKTIAEISEGDLRRATNTLQSAAAFGSITRETVYEVAAQARPAKIKEMLTVALSGKFPDARKILYDILINDGLSAEDIIKQIHKEVFDLDLPEKSKLELLEKIGEFEFRLNQGGSPEIQLEALLAQFLKMKK